MAGYQGQTHPILVSHNFRIHSVLKENLAIVLNLLAVLQYFLHDLLRRCTLFKFNTYPARRWMTRLLRRS